MDRMTMDFGIDLGTTNSTIAYLKGTEVEIIKNNQSQEYTPSAVYIDKNNALIVGGGAKERLDNDPQNAFAEFKLQMGTDAEYVFARNGRKMKPEDLSAEVLKSLKADVRQHLGEDVRAAVITVPAAFELPQCQATNAAALLAGIDHRILVTEPAAAAFAYGFQKEIRNAFWLVYDLGGGTFDVSLVTLGDSEHTVEASDGIPNVGGDDFDEILADLALETAALTASLSAFERRVLLDECREKKESLSPNTRKITIDMERVRPDWEQVTIPAETYYERCRPLIESTRTIVENLLAAYPQSQLDTLYVTGGGSELPSVARILRETFGRKVRRSAYMRSASAVGLAIRAATGADRIHEQFNQNFGIWREADSGGTIVFDLIFPRGIRLPEPGEPALKLERVYQPAHNIGHFRYLECSRLDPKGQPVGEITNWEQILFPFDSRLWGERDLSAEQVAPLRERSGLSVREQYTCDGSGNLKVKISTEPSGNTREFSIGQLAAS